MEILTLIILVLMIFYVIYQILMSIGENAFLEKDEYDNMMRELKNCPPKPGGVHEWSYSTINGKLTCIKCNFEAGGETKDEQVE